MTTLLNLDFTCVVIYIDEMDKQSYDKLLPFLLPIVANFNAISFMSFKFQKCFNFFDTFYSVVTCGILK